MIWVHWTLEAIGAFIVIMWACAALIVLALLVIDWVRKRHPRPSARDMRRVVFEKWIRARREHAEDGK